MLFSILIYSNNCKPFPKRENKRSASVDVGIKKNKAVLFCKFAYDSSNSLLPRL